jgi:hypothetical protein
MAGRAESANIIIAVAAIVSARTRGIPSFKLVLLDLVPPVCSGFQIKHDAGYSIVDDEK